MSEARLIGFNPTRIAPQFLEQLRDYGEVSFGDGYLPVSRCGLSTASLFHSGLAREVLLNGTQIGQLECFLNPSSLIYQGKLPTELVLKYTKLRIKDGDLVDVYLRYSFSHPLARSVGRYPNAVASIPFP
jgi:hypothetical protein